MTGVNFLKPDKRIYCSPRCRQRILTARYEARPPEGRERDYAAEYKRRASRFSNDLVGLDGSQRDRGWLWLVTGLSAQRAPSPAAAHDRAGPRSAASLLQGSLGRVPAHNDLQQKSKERSRCPIQLSYGRMRRYQQTVVACPPEHSGRRTLAASRVDRRTGGAACPNLD